MWKKISVHIKAPSNSPTHSRQLLLTQTPANARKRKIKAERNKKEDKNVVSGFRWCFAKQPRWSRRRAMMTHRNQESRLMMSHWRTPKNAKTLCKCKIYERNLECSHCTDTINWFALSLSTTLHHTSPEKEGKLTHIKFPTERASKKTSHLHLLIELQHCQNHSWVAYRWEKNLLAKENFAGK